MTTSRAATETIGGFLAQVSLCALRWAKAAANEIVVTEGNEDIDRQVVLDGVVSGATQESVKRLEGALSARSEEVFETIANFAHGYIEAKKVGTPTTFVLTTSASQAEQRLGGRGSLSTNILEKWDALKRAPSKDLVTALALDVKRLMHDYILDDDKRSKPFRERTRLAMQSLDAADDWADFFKAVVWSFKAVDLVNPQEKLAAALRERPEVAALLSDVRPLLASALAETLVMEVLIRSAEKDPATRCLTRDLLERLIQSFIERYKRVGGALLTLHLVHWANWRTQTLVVARSTSRRSCAAIFFIESQEVEGLFVRRLHHAMATPGLGEVARAALRQGRLHDAASSSDLIADRLGEAIVGTTALAFVGIANAEGDAGKQLRRITRSRLRAKRLFIPLAVALPDDVDWAVSNLPPRLKIAVDRPTVCGFARLVADAFERAWPRENEPTQFTRRIFPLVKLIVDPFGAPHRQGDAVWSAHES